MEILFSILSALPQLFFCYNIQDEPLLYENFPDGFLWGAATSAYRVSTRTNDSQHTMGLVQYQQIKNYQRHFGLGTNGKYRLSSAAGNLTLFELNTFGDY